LILVVGSTRLAISTVEASALMRRFAHSMHTGDAAERSLAWQYRTGERVDRLWHRTRACFLAAFLVGLALCVASIWLLVLARLLAWLWR
jgi:hypothetical protein